MSKTANEKSVKNVDILLICCYNIIVTKFNICVTFRTSYKR